MPFPNPDSQFKPGKSGNPGGRPKTARLTTALIKAIEEKGLDDPFVKVGLQHALKGDFRFWAYIFDRVDGKIPEKLLTGNADDDTETLREFLAQPSRKGKAKGQARAPRKRVRGPGGDEQGV